MTKFHEKSTNYLSGERNPTYNYLPKQDVKMTHIDSRRIITSILAIITTFEALIELYQKLKESYYEPKKKWRDQIIDKQKKLLEIAKNTKDPVENKIIIESILDFSNKIIKLAEYDFTYKKTSNPFIILMNEMNRKIDIDGKKSFWLETFDRQNDILCEASERSLNIDTKLKINGILIKYCDLVLNGFDSTLYKDNKMKNNIMSENTSKRIRELNRYKTMAKNTNEKIIKVANVAKKNPRYQYTGCLNEI